PRLPLYSGKFRGSLCKLKAYLKDTSSSFILCNNRPTDTQESGHEASPVAVFPKAASLFRDDRGDFVVYRGRQGTAYFAAVDLHRPGGTGSEFRGAAFHPAPCFGPVPDTGRAGDAGQGQGLAQE